MKLTIWLTSSFVYDELTETQRSAIDNTANEFGNKGFVIKNNDPWKIIYIETVGITSTDTDWYPLEDWDSISFNLSELQNVSIISDTASTDVRILTI